MNKVGSNSFRKAFRDKKHGVVIVEMERADKFQLSNGMEIDLPFVHFEDPNIKNYFITRLIKADSKETVVAMDFAYGNIDFSRLDSDSEYRERFLKYVVSTDGLKGFVKRHFGLLPDDMAVVQANEDFVPRDVNFLYDDRMFETVKNGVMQNAHRTEIEGRKVISQEEVEEPQDEQTDASSEKSNGSSFWGILARRTKPEKGSGWAKELKNVYSKDRRNNPQKTDEPAKEDSVGDNVVVAFWKSGAVITEITSLNPDGTRGAKKADIVPRYNFNFIEPKTKEPVNPQTILISGVEDDKLVSSKEYRSKFIEYVCVPILDYADCELRTC